MKFRKVIFSMLFCISIVFAFLCWAVPFGDIYHTPENVVVDSQDVERPFGTLVNTRYNKDANTVDFMLLNAITLRTVSATESKKVYLGGDTLGFDYTGDGLLVVSNKGLGVANEDFMAGDIIKSVNGVKLKSAADLRKILDESAAQKGLLIKIERNGEAIEKRVKPAYDAMTQKYKLGVWAKEGLNGVGTLTYIEPESGRFGALGHPIIEPNTRAILDVNTGSVQKCAVLGVKKASRGSPGEIRAVLTSSRKPLGTVDKNCETGIFGQLSPELIKSENRPLVDLGGRLNARPGKAQIYSSIDGKHIRPYDIEIIKTNYQGASSQKNLVFKVTDQRLLKNTGGIVQGMSGSPIVQDGCLIGAVTHVFVNDPTKGFGIYVDNMINN